MFKCCTLFLILLLLTAQSIFAQDTSIKIKNHYLSIQSGGMVNGYNSIGLRTFLEYQKDLKGNWQYGISYENVRHLFRDATDHPNSLNSNFSALSLNSYYKINAIKNRLFWTIGLGLGVIHVNWDQQDKVGICSNASLTLNFRISKKVYIETSPLVVLLPVNRIYVSNIKVDNYQGLYAFTAFPIGIKVKI